MQDIREIYKKTIENLEGILSRLMTELEQIEYVIDGDIVSSNGEPLDPDSYDEIKRSLTANKIEVEEEIQTVNTQIKYLQDWLATHEMK
uniref:Uncharacterized protein n=1 Tax=viral metagenome TaxID=1070528 RepID=A0A6C0AIB2_9ZZZZ